MRNESGIYYGRHTLPLWSRLAADQLNMVGKTKSVPSSQPMVPSSQPTGAASQPTSAPAASQPTSQPSAGSQPTSQPAGGADTANWPQTVPAPGTAARYAGIEPHPTFQIGGDLRLAVYSPLGGQEGEETVFFPMQTDLYLAYRPYNPKKLNIGRLTLLASVGARGHKEEIENPEFRDQFIAREWYAMYHDLPYQMYVRAGRFLPAHGWKTDDHTGFVRQGQMILGRPFDHERQVTGVEFGLNPNYQYLHVSLFNMADEWDTPIDTDLGYGAAVSGGYRDLGWQAGASLVYGARDAVGPTPKWDQTALSLQWAANLHYLTRFIPLVYLGEYHVLRTAVDAGDTTTGLAAFHELGYLVMQGLNMTVRYDWADANTDFKFDSRHRVNLGFEWYPVPFLEVIARYRHNWQHTDDRFSNDNDEILFMLHGWY